MKIEVGDIIVSGYIGEDIVEYVTGVHRYAIEYIVADFYEDGHAEICDNEWESDWYRDARNRIRVIKPHDPEYRTQVGRLLAARLNSKTTADVDVDFDLFERIFMKGNADA